MTRFIDEVGTLAIEDCLISKLPTLFRSTDVLNMSEEDVARLAGETESSSTERRRLEAKQKILGRGLQGLRSLHKRRSLVYDLQHDQAPVDKLEKMSAMTASSKSEKESVAIESAEPPSHAVIPNQLSDSPERVEVPPSVYEWMNRPEVGSNSEDPWNYPVSSKGKKKKHSRQIRDNDF